MTVKSIYSALLVLLFFLSACDNKQPAVTAVPEQKETALSPARDTVAIKEQDTVAVSNYRLFFSAADSTPVPDFLEQHGIKVSGGQMAYFTADKDQLGLLLENGDTAILKHDTTKAEHYQFFVHLPQINYHLVRVQYPEGNSYLLVNARTGKKTSIIGLPYISPSKQYIIAANEDLIAGHSANALQLLKIEKDSLANQFILDIKGWGPEKIKWLSDSSFIIQKKMALIDSAKGTIGYKRSQSLVNIHP